MSYTPTTWVTGDTITASGLNKMEQGIANAGGGALIVNASGFNDSSHYFGEILYAHYNGQKWITEYRNGIGMIYAFGQSLYYSTPIMPIPSDENLKLFWVVYEASLSDVAVTLSGDISQSPTTVYVDNGSYGQSGYEITGVGYLELVAL